MKTSKTIQGLLAGVVLASSIAFTAPLSTVKASEVYFDDTPYLQYVDDRTPKTFEQVKEIAKKVYESAGYEPDTILFYTTTDMSKQFTDYSFYTDDISQDIQGYVFQGRGVAMYTHQVAKNKYINEIFVTNVRSEEEEKMWSEKMDAGEKYIVENYTLKTEYDVVYAITDFIANQLVYGQKIPKNHPFFMETYGGVVCEDYTDITAELLKRFGIKSRILDGDMKRGPHTWNVVKLGDNWYHTDSTWVDGGYKKHDKYIVMTQSERDLDVYKYDSSFKASNVKYDISKSKAYDYKAVKKAQSAKK